MLAPDGDKALVRGILIIASPRPEERLQLLAVALFVSATDGAEARVVRQEIVAAVMASPGSYGRPDCRRACPTSGDRSTTGQSCCHWDAAIYGHTQGTSRQKSL